MNNRISNNIDEKKIINISAQEGKHRELAQLISDHIAKLMNLNGRCVTVIANLNITIINDYKSATEAFSIADSAIDELIHAIRN